MRVQDRFVVTVRAGRGRGGFYQPLEYCHSALSKVRRQTPYFFAQARQFLWYGCHSLGLTSEGSIPSALKAGTLKMG